MRARWLMGLACVAAMVLGFVIAPGVTGAVQAAALGPVTAAERHGRAPAPEVVPFPKTVGAWVAPAPTAEQLADAEAGVLSHDVPPALGGQLVVLPGSEPAPNPAAAKTVRVRIEVEAGLPVDPAAFGAFVMGTLNDPRSWGGDGSMTFARTDGEADLRVLVASAATVDDLCAPLATNGKWSCGRYGHAALNADRWINGSQAFLGAGGGLTEYRHYLVNHEVGHLFGNAHRSCPAPGTPAPVMVQQSISVQGCTPNGWPR